MLQWSSNPNRTELQNESCCQDSYACALFKEQHTSDATSRQFRSRNYCEIEKSAVPSWHCRYLPFSLSGPEIEIDCSVGIRDEIPRKAPILHCIFGENSAL